MKKLVFIFILLCFSSISFPAEWWIEPPRDTTDVLYGIGEGATLEQAQQSALNNVAGKLSTQLSSSFERLTQDTGSLSNDYMRRQVRSEIEHIELSQFQVLNVYETDRFIRVLIALDRVRLGQLWKQRIDDNMNVLMAKIEVSRINTLSQWLELQSLLPLAQSTRNLSLNLQALNGTSPGPDIYRIAQDKLNSQEISLQVKGPNSEINRAINQELRKQGIMLCNIDCNAVINYHTEFSRTHLFGEYTSTLNLYTDVRENGRQIASNSWQLRASSVVSFESADHHAVRQVNESLHVTGLWQKLGFN